MRVIIAGPRDWKDGPFIWASLSQCERARTATRVIVGGAHGVDSLAEDWAIRIASIPQVCVFPADWGKYGRAAGPMRNKQMVASADALVAFQDPKHPTPGTQDIIRQAKAAGLEVVVLPLKRR